MPPSRPNPALVRAVKSIGEPRHYYTGIAGGLAQIPGNILLFPRLSRSEMQRYHSRLSAHHRYLLIVPLMTAGTVQLEHLFLRLSPGTAILVQPFQLHRSLRFEREAMVWLYVTFELQDAAALAPLRNKPVHLPAESWEHLSALVGQYQAPGDKSAVERTRLALRLGLLLNELQAAESALHRQALPPTASSPDALVERACHFISDGLAQGVSIRLVADHCHVSESHLRALFRGALGTSLGQYIRAVRMWRAAQLAALSDLNVTAIAQRCGFDSIYSFSRAFKRDVGLSPTQYRQRYAPPARAGRASDPPAGEELLV